MSPNVCVVPVIPAKFYRHVAAVRTSARFQLFYVVTSDILVASVLRLPWPLFKMCTDIVRM